MSSPTPNITLYSSPGSCSIIAKSLLYELSIPFTDHPMRYDPNGIESVDGTLDRAAYLKIHPSGYVPALVVDGQVITENPAIFRYISGLAPERHVLGRKGVEEAKVEEWLVWCAGTVHGYGFAGLWRPGRFVDDAALHEAVKAKAMKTILASFEKIEKKIVGPYVMGGEWTAPDLFLHTFWRWGKKIGVENMEGRYPRWRELIREVEKVGGLREAMKGDGIELFFP